MSDTSMFNFLFEEDVKNGLDLGTLVEFGKEASNALIGVGEVPLNDSITKIAQIHNLDSNQIDIVCQEANKATHKGMFKTASEKYVTFNVADSSQVRNMLNGVVEKTASVSSYDLDYAVAPGETQSFRDYSMTKTASGSHNGLWDNSKTLVKKNLEKLAMKKQEIEDQLLMKTAALQSKEKEFIKTACHTIGNESYSFRKQAMQDMATYVLSSGMSEDRTYDLLLKTAKVLAVEGVVEKSDATHDAIVEAIKGADDDAIINTTHQFQKTVQTIKDFDRDKDALVRAKNSLVRTAQPNE